MIGRSKSKSDLPERLDALEGALSVADARLDAEAVAYGQHVLDKANQRLKHGTAHTLVALLGATGAGKSSLANQLIGSDIATTGVRRPTTSSTMACSWGPDDPHQLLDWLEVSSRHSIAESASELDGLILLDVPDHDSVTDANRAEMERIAEHADLLVWVTDPEKYADASMHGYLKQLSSHNAVILMVLNKSDRLSSTELDLCRNDLARLLTADGLLNTQMVTTSATTGHGIGDLRKLLAKSVAEKASVAERLGADLSVAVDRLREQMPFGQNPIVSSGSEKKLAKDLVDSAGIGAVADAVASAHKQDAALAVGWPVTRWAGKLRRHPLNRLHLGEQSTGRSSLPGIGGANQKRALASIRGFADEASSGLVEPWPTLVRTAATPEISVLKDEVDAAVSKTVRDRVVKKPNWWAVVRLVQNILAAVMVVGLVWLAVIFAVAWFQLPAVPTPEYRGFPIPTLAALGGALAGVLLGFLAKQLARTGANRRKRQVRSAASKAVGEVSTSLVVTPVRLEVDRYNQLDDYLSKAAGV